jgi:hypothetical protein
VLVLVLEGNAGVVSDVYMLDLLASSRGLCSVPLYTKPSSTRTRTSTIWLRLRRAGTSSALGATTAKKRKFYGIRVFNLLIGISFT